ncbi:hypothetical protein [Flavobacterium sangjuense]|uniref:Adenylosuccinate lyase n=1 Tax=Flavobacterium sangjuense TaxID=2518177 RepID=A0A4P7PTW5_9FLAO|nr:hypothetical protein [Flavobacterium sangjuense]QBZ97662.1 hypothetical protein GS03_01160 [Flavobacterium sangjuense]
MDLTFFNRIAKSNASTNCRNGNRDFVVENPEYLKDLVAFATDLTNKNHYKAVWIIEMLVETHTKMLAPFVDIICETIPKYKHESAIRGMSRTVFFLSTSKTISLSETQQEKLIEICLDWLIGDAKVAPKAYAMYTLGHYAKKHDWIKEELRNIIDKDFASQSAGYKAAAREVLRKISK